MTKRFCLVLLITLFGMAAAVLFLLLAVCG